MMRRSIHRRSFLRGAGGICLGLPFLEIMSTQAGGPPPAAKRLVFFFSNNGTVHNDWRPTGPEDAPVLGEILQPLQPHADQLLLLSGIDMESSYHGPGSGDPHMPGMAHMLTGTEMIDIGPGSYEKRGGGISVDQLVAQSVGTETKFSSLHYGVQARQYSSSPWNSMSFRGANDPVEPEDDPVKMFERVFGDVGGEDPQLAVLRAQRHSVLDAVKGDIGDLQGKLGASDQARLEQHLDSIRDVERAIDDTTTEGGNCTIPPMPSAIAGSLYAHGVAPELMRAQIELLVMSLACDLTRVATIQWREALGGDSTFTWLGHSETHHDISHRGDGDAVGRQQMIEINNWFAAQFAHLIGLMNQIDEGNGSLLDNSVVVWCNELAKGNAHSRRDMAYVLAGSCGGHLRTGRHLQFGGDYHNDLLVSLCQAMDVDVDTFGNPAYCTGPLLGLT